MSRLSRSRVSPVARSGAANKISGAAGEDFAAAALDAAGYRILDRNWSCRDGELDIVALDATGYEPHLVFCEVKTRRTRAFGDPCEAVNPEKQRRIRVAALEWLAGHADVPHGALRFDIFEIVVVRGMVTSNHLRNAF